MVPPTASAAEIVWVALAGLGLGYVLTNLRANRASALWLDRSGLNGPRQAAVGAGLIAQGILLASSVASLAVGILAALTPASIPPPGYETQQTISVLCLIVIQALIAGLSWHLRRTRIAVLREIDAEEADVARLGGVPIRGGAIAPPGTVRSMPPNERARSHNEAAG